MIKKIEFTERAKKQIKKITAENKTKKYFRISVKGGGCSGFKYNFSFDNVIEKDDVVFDLTVIDKNSLDIIAGSTVDFKTEMIGESFVIKIHKHQPLVVVVYLLLLNEDKFLECKFN